MSDRGSAASSRPPLLCRLPFCFLSFLESGIRYKPNMYVRELVVNDTVNRQNRIRKEIVMIINMSYIIYVAFIGLLV